MELAVQKLYRKRRLFASLCCLSLILCLWLGHVPYATWQFQVGKVVNAQNSTLSQLVRQGVNIYQSGNFIAAIEIWNEALKDKNIHPANKVIVWENLARAYQQVGNTEAAINRWEEVIGFYRRQGNKEKLGRSLTEIAQLYSSLGQPKKAIAILCPDEKAENCGSGGALQIARDAGKKGLEAAVFGSLGDAYRLTGEDDFTKAINYLEKVKDNPVYKTSITNSLGNAYLSRAILNYRRANSKLGRSKDIAQLKEEASDDAQKALEYLKQSRDNARYRQDKQGEIRAIMSLIHFERNIESVQKVRENDNINYEKNTSRDKINNLLDEATNLLASLPNNQTRLYFIIDVVRLRGVIAGGCLTSEESKKAEILLNDTIEIAKNNKDYRAESFALGETGHIYECRGSYPTAMKFTEEARLVAEQKMQVLDGLYLWEWQTGRILKVQGKAKEAIAAYEKAINTLEGKIRPDILTANRDIQFDFRDTIEPIYRDLLSLKLSLEKPINLSSKSVSSKDSQINFSSILKTIDSFKLAELENFFGNDCNLPGVNQDKNELQKAKADEFLDKAVKLNKIPEKTALIHTVIFKDKTVVILTLPNGETKFYQNNRKREVIESEILKFRNAVKDPSLNFDTKIAKQIYDWMISPFANELDSKKIETLVFIQDGILRSVPMAALHDGNQYLIQNYAIATIPSLTLIEPKEINRRGLQVLALGVSANPTVNGKELGPLANVCNEIPKVTNKIGGKKLLNGDFTRDNLKKELSKKAYPIIHVATHGKFGIKPEDTFIVTGDGIAQNKDKSCEEYAGSISSDKNNKITFNELDNLIRQFTRNRQPIELLTLTACETAVGDDRSALGLGGVALQAGARSVFASLWLIADEETAEIAIEFYDKLLNEPNYTKAKALQAVQKKFIDEGENISRPYYWSGFVMIGNWL